MNKIWVLVILIVALSPILSLTIFPRHEKGKKGQIVQAEEKTPVAAAKNLNITVCYDNNPYKEKLITAWGFSCVIRGTEKTILFDTGGDGSILLTNLEELGINPKEIDLVVLSHIHGDHVGGLPSFLEKNSEVVVYLPKSFPKDFKDKVKEYGAKIVEVQESLKICQEVYSTGEMGTWIKEQSLIIQTKKRLIVITGCAHPGIVKIVNKVKDLFKDDVFLVMGGFHLGGENKGGIENIISSFRKLGVNYAGPCHCSGDSARQLFKKEYGENFINVGVGRVVTMNNLK
ncbi:MAG: MBL fold metallo-hydrolase [Candidatus Atribacteria bacterium]|nr:MBL fold metallo-hydrolase [Candidatus Atribacteria bacterium]